jgi:putative flavoprotein involved in K+ transport
MAASVDWLDRMGYYSMPIADHPDPRAVRSKTNHYLTGRDGGREIDLRARALEGMHLHGRLQSITAERISFHDDLALNLDQADAVYCRSAAALTAGSPRRGLKPSMKRPIRPVGNRALARILASISAAGI